MKRYLKVIITLIKSAISKGMIYRENFIFSIFFSLIQLVIYLLSISIIFGKATNLAGWSKEEVVMLLGFSYFVRGVFLIFIRRGLDQIGELIRSGDFDSILLKPLSPVFYLSFSSFNISAIPYTIYGLILFVYSLINSGASIVTVNLFVTIIISICSIFVYFGLYLSLMTIYFWSLSSNIEYLFLALGSLTSYPLDILSSGVKFVFSWIIPIAFFSYFPVGILLGKINPSIGFFVIPLTFIIFFSSIKIWKFALKSYTSASS